MRERRLFSFCCISHMLCFLFAECHAKIFVYPNKTIDNNKIARYRFAKITILQCVQRCIKTNVCKHVQYHNHTCLMLFTRVTRHGMRDRESSMVFERHRCRRKSRRHKYKHTKVLVPVDGGPSWRVITAATPPPKREGRYTLRMQGVIS